MVVNCTAYIITAYFPGPAMTYSIPTTLSNPVMAILVIRLLTCGIPLTGILLRLCYSSGNHGGQHTSAALLWHTAFQQPTLSNPSPAMAVIMAPDMWHTWHWHTFAAQLQQWRSDVRHTAIQHTSAALLVDGSSHYLLTFNSYSKYFCDKILIWHKKCNFL